MCWSISSLFLILQCHVLISHAAIKIQTMGCECGSTTNWNNRIVGGWEANAHDFPWAVAITDKGRLHCGGSVINDKYVLSAGHCIRWNNMTDMELITGVHDIRTANQVGTRYTVVQMILHPNFFSHKLYDENDIALLKADRPILFSDKVKPICLPKKGMEPVFGRYGIIVGWGRLEAGGRQATTLRQAFVKMLSPKECSATKMAPYLAKTVYCAYHQTADSCQGDSGGPLIIELKPGKMVQVGLVSWGIGCASDTPGIYTKVIEYLPWIYESTQDSHYCKNE